MYWKKSIISWLVMTEYEQGFYDARDSVLSLIDEWYETYKPDIDLLPTKVAIGFLKKAISDADVLEAE
jgi:hypothetical protein